MYGLVYINELHVYPSEDVCVVQVLRLYNGSNDIEGLDRSRVLTSRFCHEWHEDVQQRLMIRTNTRKPPPPHDIDPIRGSAYGIFSRLFVRFVLEDRRAQDLLQWSRTVWSPDEFYWATLHHTHSNPHLHTPGAFSGQSAFYTKFCGWFLNQTSP